MILTFHHCLVSFLVCPVLLVYKQRTNDIPTNLGCTLFCANQQVLACLRAKTANKVNMIAINQHVSIVFVSMLACQR